MHHGAVSNRPAKVQRIIDAERRERASLVIVGFGFGVLVGTLVGYLFL